MYQAALKAYSENLNKVARSMQKNINISEVVNLQLANQIKLPDLSKISTPPLAYKKIISSFDSTALANLHPVLDQLKQVSNLSVFNNPMPSTKLISNVVKSATLANRLSFSSSVLSKDMLRQAIKIPTADWNYQQDSRQHQGDFQSAFNSQTDLAKSYPTSNEIYQVSNSVSSKITQQKDIGKNHEHFSQTISKHSLPPLPVMLDIAEHIILAMQVFHLSDEYIQIAYIALIGFIAKQYFDSKKQ